MPRYAALIYTGEGDASPEEWAQVMADYGEFGDKAEAAGVIQGGEALQPTSTATTVHVESKGASVQTTDGPFAETKEALGGFYLLDCKDLDEAIHWAAQIPGAWHGRIEVRPLMEFEEGA